MANKTIPQLPEQTGKTDNDLLAIVDSGETTTSKIKVSTLLAGVGGKYIAADGTNNIVPDYYATSAIDSGSSESAIIAGTGNTIPNSTTYSVIVGSLNSTNNSIRGGIYSSQDSIVHNDTAGVVVGGQSNIVGTGGYYQGVFAGQSNTASGIHTAIVGGTTNDATGTSQRSVIAGGQSNDVTNINNFIGGGTGNIASSQQSCVIGGRSNTSNGFDTTILGGRNNLINGNGGAILGSNYSNVTGKGGCVIASEYADVNESSTIIGGWGTYIYSDISGASQPQFGSYAIYSPYSYVRRDNGTGTSTIYGKQNGILSSDTCEINGQLGNITDRGVIIGSNNTNLTGGTTNTLMLGCSGRTGTNSYTTYVETLEAFTHVVLNDYSNLNFSGDTAAAAGNVPLGGLYHDNGALRVRIV